MFAPRTLYAAFDRFPSPKGAAVHIGEWADELFTIAGAGVLHVLGGDGLPAFQRDRDDGRVIETVRFTAEIPNLLDRTEHFGRHLAAVTVAHLDTLELVHVRDPWSARGVLAAAAAEPSARPFRFVYEVNGLPSIELPYHYPALGPETLAKVRDLELRALEAADAVATPSRVLADRLQRLGVPAAKITVIPNGARLPIAPPPRPIDAPPRYIVYVGALQRWQGVDTLLAAMTRLADLPDLRLVICSATPPKRARPYVRLAQRLGIADRIDWHDRVPHAEVAGWLAHAVASVAPLADCARNVDQGCCPLKIVESMAVGTPVVASDLAVVRELVVDGEHGRLVPADRPADLARAIRVLLEYPERTALMGASAKALVEASLTWSASRRALRELYRGLGFPGGPRAATN